MICCELVGISDSNVVFSWIEPSLFIVVVLGTFGQLGKMVFSSYGKAIWHFLILMWLFLSWAFLFIVVVLRTFVQLGKIVFLSYGKAICNQQQQVVLFVLPSGTVAAFLISCAVFMKGSWFVHRKKSWLLQNVRLSMSHQWGDLSVSSPINHGTYGQNCY